MLRPEALMRLSAPEHRFCATPECRAAYFGIDEVFERQEIVVPIFEKEPAGDRTVCYCFGVSEADIRRELVETTHSTVSERITALVRADRCACEVKNPQGSCCLGNVAAAVKATLGGEPTLAGADEVGLETDLGTGLVCVGQVGRLHAESRSAVLTGGCRDDDAP